ncbi:MAG: DUF932 domain-containing protein, partial [Prevotellaceae bacterium]|nr:DUF932 domain-containing protein [Prevotellaceae bacterium]
DFDDEERTTNIAIAFHQRGIQVGFGNMVKICHNQCMLGAEQYAATYSDKGEGKGSGKTIAELLDAVRSWLVDARQIVITEREKIDRMKQITVLPEQAYTMIGMLTALRVKCDTSNKDLRENRVYPLNQAQISQFTENLLVRYAKCLRVSLWDVYNAATDLYKARTMDIPQLLPQNRAFVQFIEQTYAI